MRRPDIEREELAIYWVAILVLAPVVVIALSQHAAFDGGATLCLVAVVLAGVGIVSHVVRNLLRPRLPRARVSARRGRTSSRVAPQQDD